MSYANCIQTIAQAAGRELSDKEVRAIFERVHQAALDIKAGRASAADIEAGKKVSAIAPGAGDIVRAAAERAAADLMHEAQVRERQANLQVVALGARAADAKSLRASGLTPLEAVRGLITRDYSGRTNVAPLELLVSGHKSNLGRQLLQTWDALGNDWLGFFQDRAKLLDLVRELRGEDSGNALAKKGAKAFHEVAEMARRMFNAAGGDVGRLDDWGMPQHHSQERVARAGKTTWIDAILPMLARSRYVDELGIAWSDARMRDFLGKAYDNIATDGLATLEPGQPSGAGKRANRHAESRQLHFKDAESVIDYWSRFGDKSPVEILAGHIDTMARDIAFVERFGPNPELTYKVLRDTALRDSAMANNVRTESVKGQAVKLDSLWAYASGNSKPTANLTLSKIADAIANLNVAAKLGGAALASFFGDKPMMEAVSHLNNLPLFQRWRNELMLLNPANASDRRLIQQQGLMLEGIRSGLSRFYEGLGKGDGWTGKTANAVMRATGMSAINDIRKGSFGLSLMHAIGNEVASGRGFDALGESDIRALRHWGITEADWKVWQLAKLDDLGHGNANVLTPESIARIPDTEIAKVFGADIQKRQQGIGDKIAELMGRNAHEDERLAKRLLAIKQAEAKAAERLNRFMTTRDARLVQAKEWAAAQSELLRLRVDRAEAQADVDAYLLQQRVRNQTTDLVVDMIRRRDIEKALGKSDAQMDRASQQRGNIGETVGEIRGRNDRRIIELEAKAREIERTGSAEVKAKYEEMRGDIQRLLDDADQWYGESQKRVERRNAVIDRLLGDASAAQDRFVAETRNNAIVKLLGAVNTESEFAIVTPGWAERSAFYADLQRGTVKGEVVRSVLQFKSFPYTQLLRVLDATKNMEGPVGKAMMTAGLVAGTTLTGAMLLQTREMLSGKDPRKMFDDDWAKFWGSAFLAGGALGIYSDFLYSLTNTRYGSGWTEMLAGPTMGPLVELAFVQPADALKKTIEGKESHFLARQFQDLKGFVPGGNIWYTKAALDHLIWQNVMEHLSPGYLGSMRQRTMKEFNQDWWWQPGELSPDRAPDFARAIQ